MLYNLFENRDFVSVFAVALLAEGVDRNNYMAMAGWKSEVALLAEGVDRNTVANVDYNGSPLSPSSRRAWIEICHPVSPALFYAVALLAEGVDRNWLSGS